MQNNCHDNPALWIAAVEPLLQTPAGKWGDNEKTDAERLLRLGCILVQCRLAVPPSDLAYRIIERAQCLAQCAEDLAADIVRAASPENRLCPWCQGQS